MTDKTIMNSRVVGGNYFRLYHCRKSKYNLSYYLTKFDPNLYFIYKRTRNQREVSYEEFLKFEYSCYIFFRKDLYNIEDINKWIDFIGKFGGIMYLDQFPPIEMIEKIKLK